MTTNANYNCKLWNGEFGSVLTAVRNLGRQAEITRDPRDLERADKVILLA